MTAIIAPQQGQEQATDLVAAQIGPMLTVLRLKRAELTAQIADLDGRGPTGDVRIDQLSADLNIQMRSGLAAINLLIDQAETFAGEMTRDEPSA